MQELEALRRPPAGFRVYSYHCHWQLRRSISRSHDEQLVSIGVVASLSRHGAVVINTLV
jgi:hypothetical protein